MANQNICLISTVHDPAGKLAPFIRKYLPLLVDIYGEIRVNVTEKTHLETWKALGKHGSIGKTAGNGAEGRRRALRLGLETDCETFHYCDFDRILYWVAHHPRELERIIENSGDVRTFIILERSVHAIKSHPIFQRLTEGIANFVFSEWYSDNHALDFLSGSRLISRPCVLEILWYSKENNAAAIDFEWPTILGRERVVYQSVDGLAYEHRFLGIEKPFSEEIKTRLNNLFEIIKLRYVTR